MIEWLLSLFHDPLVSAGFVSILTGVVMHVGLDQATAATLAKMGGTVALSWFTGWLARSPIAPKTTITKNPAKPGEGD